MKKRELPKAGDEIEIEFSLTKESHFEPEPLPLSIIYEDEWLLAINKPVGLVVHPAPGHWSGTFANALLYHCKELQREPSIRPGIVHRLDKETSGVLLGAKTEGMQRKLVELFQRREIHKEYLAITLGNPGKGEFLGKIGRHPKKRQQMALVLDKGKEAITHYETLRFDGALAVVALFPKTGRTHQLRVQLSAHKTPILGDPIYGSDSLNRKYKVERTLLHAHAIAFVHPMTGQSLEIKAPLADDIRQWVEKIYASTDSKS